MCFKEASGIAGPGVGVVYALSSLGNLKAAVLSLGGEVSVVYGFSFLGNLKAAALSLGMYTGHSWLQLAIVPRCVNLED